MLWSLCVWLICPLDAIDPVSVKCYSASFETFSPVNLTSDIFTSLSDSSICGVRHLDPTVFMYVLHFNIETNSIVGRFISLCKPEFF